MKQILNRQTRLTLTYCLAWFLGTICSVLNAQGNNIASLVLYYIGLLAFVLIIKREHQKIDVETKKGSEVKKKDFAIWKDGKVIGYINLDTEQAKDLNHVDGIDLYFGYDEVIRPGKYTDKVLKR